MPGRTLERKRWDHAPWWCPRCWTCQHLPWTPGASRGASELRQLPGSLGPHFGTAAVGSEMAIAKAPSPLVSEKRTRPVWAGQLLTKLISRRINVDGARGLLGTFSPTNHWRQRESALLG